MRYSPLRRAALLLVLLAAANGCTKFASEGDEIAAEELFPEPDGDWSCVSESAGNPIMPTNGPPLSYSIEARDYVTGQTPDNLRIRACYRGDLECAYAATDFIRPDDSGVVTLPLTIGFNGYLEIVGDNMVPTLNVFPGPMTPQLAAAVGAVPVALLPLDVLAAFGQATQIELSPELGVISLNTYDCVGPSAPGVRLELNTVGLPYQFVDGLPIPYQDTTTRDSSGGFANVQPGLVVVKGFRAGTAELVGLETILVRARWVTVASLMPQYAAD